MPIPSVITRFVLIIDALCKVVGERQGKGIYHPLAWEIWRRLRRIAALFTAIVMRIEAGTLRPSQPRAPRTTPRAPPKPPDPRMPPPEIPFPPVWGWLAALLPGTGAVIGGQLRALLDDPEMAKVLTASPALRRLLRPLMVVLAQEPHPALAAPPRARRRKREVARRAEEVVARRPPRSWPRAPEAVVVAAAPDPVIQVGGVGRRAGGSRVFLSGVVSVKEI